MRDEEEEMNDVRKTVTEWGNPPYYYQNFNKDESPDWRHHVNKDEYLNLAMLDTFLHSCDQYKSFDFSIGTNIVGVGEVKLCSYTELQQITDFKHNEIQKTLAGRLFSGTIGSEKRSAIVKTWDFLLPCTRGHMIRPYDFCDQIELLTNKEANTHPKLAKLSAFCCDTRLAAVYDERFDANITTVLSDVLLKDEFGWDDRVKVAIQLADLLVWLHEKGIIFGSVTASCIMIQDKEMNIKVFDFGPVSDRMCWNSKMTIKCHTGPEAPEQGNMTTKSDVFVFGLLLVELITKKEFDYMLLHRDKRSNLADESFKEVDPEIASRITSLAYSCIQLDADKRPTMKNVLDVLTAAAAKMTGVKGEKRKRDKDEVEEEAATTLLA